MATAEQEKVLAARGLGCLGKAEPNEPIFILRAQDELAADLVDLWAERAQLHGCPMSKVLEAIRLADAMRRWPTRKYPD